MVCLLIYEMIVKDGNFNEEFVDVLMVDLNIFGIFLGKFVESYKELVLKVNIFCFFVLDFGYENVFV